MALDSDGNPIIDPLEPPYADQASGDRIFHFLPGASAARWQSILKGNGPELSVAAGRAWPPPTANPG
jgi:hypothetical protein